MTRHRSGDFFQYFFIFFDFFSPQRPKSPDLEPTLVEFSDLSSGKSSIISSTYRDWEISMSIVRGPVGKWAIAGKTELNMV